jgi:hypothetical protein
VTDVFQFQASIAPGQESETSLEVFQRLVDRRTGHRGIHLNEPTWMSLWRANVRMVERYRQDRVFLAGEAAHVHSPAGGHAQSSYGDSSLYVVRPDNYIGMAMLRPAAAPVVDYLKMFSPSESR